MPPPARSPRPPLVYLPGLDGTGRLLHRQPRLFEEYDVRPIAYPHEPHGYSELAALAAAQLEKTGPGVVLAESFGGAVALTLALERPELVRRLMLVNTFAWYPTRWVIRPIECATYLFPHRPAPAISRLFRGLFFFAPEIPTSERREWWDRTRDVPMTAFAYRLRMVARVDLRPRLSEVAAPALVLAAPNDRVVPAAAGAYLARHLPHARLIRPRVGHAALIHPAVDVAALLADPHLWPDVTGAGKGWRLETPVC